MSQIIYSKQYNISIGGLEQLHPFDTRKYGRAYERLGQRVGASRLSAATVTTDREATREELLLVHTQEYLERLRDSAYLASAFEVPVAARVPNWILDRQVMRPMRWGTRGTILAAEAALETGLAVNLGGGFHHAKPDRGEGFCIYNDIGIAIAALRKEGRILDTDGVLYVDTDAHQGNGVCHVFLDDPSVFIFDVFVDGIYPFRDQVARKRIDAPVAIAPLASDDEYLRTLQSNLSETLRAVEDVEFALAIYNAGTDVFEDDPLGSLQVSAAGILERDLFVINALRERGIPTVMLLSGGYTQRSFELVVETVERVVFGGNR